MMLYEFGKLFWMDRKHTWCEKAKSPKIPAPKWPLDVITVNTPNPLPKAIKRNKLKSLETNHFLSWTIAVSNSKKTLSQVHSTSKEIWHLLPGMLYLQHDGHWYLNAWADFSKLSLLFEMMLLLTPASQAQECSSGESFHQTIIAGLQHYDHELRHDWKVYEQALV